jgi:hypothetical protein
MPLQSSQATRKDTQTNGGEMAVLQRSRRKLLFDLLPAGLHSLADAQPGVAGGVRLISPDVAEFDGRISSRFAQLVDWEGYPQFKKFMAFIQHDGTVKAKAYCVVWVFQLGDGRQRSIRAHYIHKHLMPKISVRTLESGSERLISPFFNISATDFKAHPNHAAIKIPPNFPFQDAEVLSVSIDAVIYSDGSVAGQDKYDLRTRYIGTRNAEHDEAFLLLRELSKPTSTPDSLHADSILEKHFQAGIDAVRTYSQDWKKQFYVRALGQEAAIMRNVLSTRGLNALKANALRRIRFPQTIVSPVGQSDEPSA